ncbi:MAG TPA: hypothetical protein VG896_03790 [Candidatus Nitrosotalea sp.]|nr:hypothetical protein [Candidatus Nitrosotalea sp.]
MHGRATILEIATTNYEIDLEIVSTAMAELQSLCEIKEGFLISKPMERFGWAFFKVLIKIELLSGMELKLGDQIAKSKGKKIEEKFVMFMTKFFENKNAKVKVKLVDD